MHKKWAGVTHAYLAPQKTVVQLTLFWNARLLTTGLRSFPSWKILMTVIVAFDNRLVRSPGCMGYWLATSSLPVALWTRFEKRILKPIINYRIHANKGRS